jgi:hypothetical protein
VVAGLTVTVTISWLNSDPITTVNCSMYIPCINPLKEGVVVVLLVMVISGAPAGLLMTDQPIYTLPDIEALLLYEAPLILKVLAGKVMLRLPPAFTTMPGFWAISAVHSTMVKRLINNLFIFTFYIGVINY